MSDVLLNDGGKVCGAGSGYHVVIDEVFCHLEIYFSVIVHDDLDEIGFGVDHSTTLRDADDRSILVGARLEKSRLFREVIEDAMLPLFSHWRTG